MKTWKSLGIRQLPAKCQGIDQRSGQCLRKKIFVREKLFIVNFDPRSRSQALESLEIQPFLAAISSPIYNVGWQMTTDTCTTAQYLKLIWAGFLNFVLVFVSRD